MPELIAADVIGAEFGNENRLETDHLLGLSSPPALRATREAGPAPKRFEQLGDLGGSS